jgi:membrane protease subunit HflC
VRSLLIGVAFLILIGFVLKSMTFTVSFTESAIRTTFGRVSESGVITEPGLKFKLPSPLQDVTIYDRRARVLEAPGQQIATADGRQIVAHAFMTWSITDPVVFYRRFARGAAGREPREHYKRAEDTLADQLRAALAVVSNYNLDDLFNESESGSQLQQLEQEIAARLRSASGDASLAANGIEIGIVGINRVRLPANVTSKVIERMNDVRRRIAAEARNEGQAEAERIRSEATTAAERIKAFSEVRASQIRASGEKEAARWIAVLAENPELAEFMAYIEHLTNGFGRRMTLVLTPDAVPARMFSDKYIEEHAAEAQERAPAPSEAPMADDIESPEVGP